MLLISTNCASSTKMLPLCHKQGRVYRTDRAARREKPGNGNSSAGFRSHKTYLAHKSSIQQDVFMKHECPEKATLRKL